MRDLAVLFLHLLTIVARLAGPGGARASNRRIDLSQILELFERHNNSFEQVRGTRWTATLRIG